MDRRIVTALSILAILIFFISIYSIISDSVYANAGEQLSYCSTDFANIVFGVPYLITGAWLLHRKNNRWILVVPGALVYVVYVYIPYVLALRVNKLFLLYILLIVSSLYLLAIVLATRDYQSIERNYAGNCPLRMMIVVLFLLGVFVAIRQSALAIIAVVEGMSVELVDRVMWFDDLVLGCPALLLGAYFLYKRKGIGYVIGPGMLLCYAILSLGLMPYFYLESRYTGSPIQWEGVGIIMVMAIVCLVPLIRYLKCLAKSERSS